MLVRGSQSRKISNSPNCIFWEYPLETGNLSVGRALINGRYPENGRVTNHVCEETYAVVSGSGVIYSEYCGVFPIEEGDVYLFKPGERYVVYGHNLLIDVVNVPAWYPEQHEIID